MGYLYLPPLLRPSADLLRRAEADPWTPPARVRALERFHSVRSVVGLPGVGHCPHDEAPELVNPMIVDFVRSLNVEVKAAA